MVRFNSDVEKIPFNRAKVLFKEAQDRGIEIYEIKPFNLSMDIYSAKIGNKSKIFAGLPRPETIDQTILDWIDDKWIIKKKLAEAGLPAPKGGSFSNLNSATKYFKSLGKPVVVKPRQSSRNRHTTVLVQTEEQLAKAFKVAKQICLYVIVEEYLYGDVYRGTVIDGKLIGVMGISPAKVKGDEIHTIAELVEIHNNNLPTGMIPIAVADKHINHLALLNLNLKSVLSKGQTVALSEKMGTNYGGTSYDCTNNTHPEIKEALIKAGLMVGDPILGFDFICEDVTKRLSEQTMGIIECNGAPFINLHSEVSVGTPINAAKYVWDLFEPVK